MDVGLTLAIAVALGFAFTNGFHDASNAIATLVATRVARPSQAILLAAVFTMLGPLLVGAAVATTIGGVVTVPDDEVVSVVGSGLVAATAWNLLTWWRGLPSSSGHALVGGLMGAALVTGGFDAVGWGGFQGWRPVGVAGTLVALALSPLAGALVAFALTRALAVLLRRGTRRLRTPVNVGQWAASAAVAFSHGANDAQKAVGAMVAVMLATGSIGSARAPLWVEAAAAGALTLGTVLGGWRIALTVGRGIYRIRPLDGLSIQAGSSAVVLVASFLGAPVSTTHVVASAVVGAGGGRRRWRHVRWPVVREMLVAWVTTLPACALLAIPTVVAWRWLA